MFSINYLFQYPAVINGKEKPKLYMSNNDFQCESKESVIITHVISPDNFYVRKVRDLF